MTIMSGLADDAAPDTSGHIVAAEAQAEAHNAAGNILFIFPDSFLDIFFDIFFVIQLLFTYFPAVFTGNPDMTSRMSMSARKN